MTKSKNFYYIPFDGGSSVYDKAYSHLECIDHRISIKVVNTGIDILMLPYGATVILEAINSITWQFFLRLDIKILHAPRGGASLKIGWKTLRRLNWHIRFRLKRRNYILFRNAQIARYYSLEEEIPQEKILLGGEVVDKYLLTIPRVNEAVHISLSECWSGLELMNFLKDLINCEEYKGKKLSISLHPAIKLTPNEVEFLVPYLCEFGENCVPSIFITDCVSSVFLADLLKINIKIVEEKQTFDRSLFIPQESIFCIQKINLQSQDQNLALNLSNYQAGSSPLLETNNINSFSENLLSLS